MRTDCARGGKSAAQIGVKRAGPRALQALLQNQSHRMVGAREGSGTIVGADHALRRRRFGAIGAQRASAPDADGDGFDWVRETFHPPLKLLHNGAKRKSERSFRWQSTSSFCQKWFGRFCRRVRA